MTAPALIGFPDGPKTYVAELGQSVGTFAEMPVVGPKCLKWHVPLHKRGPFRPTELANHSLENNYRVTPEGYLLCYGHTKAGLRCAKKAVNRYPRCELHGGALHPFDKVATEPTEDISDEARREAMTRYQEFKAGLLTADELDDEELASGGFRSKKNGNIYRPKNVPRELANAFQRAIFERAQEELRGLAVDAARTVGEIMKSKTIEPDIRLKAALAALERTLGKTATNVIVSQDKPFEHVFADLEVSSREHFRRNSTTIIDGSTGEVTEGHKRFDVDSDPFGIGNPAIETSIGFAEEPQTHNPIGAERSGPAVASVREALFDRNDAILAQFVERKPFEYDLKDNSEDIKKATKKRYVSRALGIDITGPQTPYSVEIKRTKAGTFVKYVELEKSSIVKSDNKSAATARKRYTLDDF